jgi:FtsP/CotA-like multicopper oxidase with cupredoxin domain
MIVVAAWLLLPGVVDAQATPMASCPADVLHCTELVAPPELSGVSGSLELQPIVGPFGVAVTRDGAPRYGLVARVRGLPAPSSLGAFTTYVAWAYTVTMDSAVNLGVVRNGRISLGEVTREQFRVIITAEPSAKARERSGRIVLRGTSPGARLLAHRDLMQAVAPGAPMTQGHEHSAAVWPMQPMPSGGAMTMPGMRHLVPSAEPWLPPARADVPLAVPRQIVEIRDGDTLRLTAALVKRTIAGRSLVMYGFNGQYPGPLIRATRGATMVVELTNALDQPTTVHWHGVRLDNHFDGVPDVTQAPVPPGGRFLYRVHFRDAGIYWYHPHVREDIQQDLGLYGNILVAESASAPWLPKVDREEVLALDDLLLDDAGLAPYGEASPTNALMGRWGNVFLVNGEPRYSLAVRRGEVVRYYFTNASNARVYNLSFGAGARMKVVASDAGKFEHETWASSVVIAPAERYVVDVRFDSSGNVALTNRVQALDHMYGVYAAVVDTLGVVTVALGGAPSEAAIEFPNLRRNSDVTAELARYRRYFDRPPDHTLILSLETHDLPQPVALMLNSLNVPMDWNDGMAMANWVTTGREVRWILRDVATGRENMDVRWEFERGSVVKLRLFNDPTSVHAMDHPIHLHGQRFLILSRNGVPNPNLVWKDTGLIPAGETVDLLVDMSNPGTWLLHCHIAEHMGTGMMLPFVVK